MPCVYTHNICNFPLDLDLNVVFLTAYQRETPLKVIVCPDEVISWESATASEIIPQGQGQPESLLAYDAVGIRWKLPLLSEPAIGHHGSHRRQILDLRLPILVEKTLKKEYLISYPVCFFP